MLIDLLIDQQLHVNGCAWIVVSNPGPDGIKVFAVFCATNNALVGEYAILVNPARSIHQMRLPVGLWAGAGAAFEEA